MSDRATNYLNNFGKQKILAFETTLVSDINMDFFWTQQLNYLEIIPSDLLFLVFLNLDPEYLITLRSQNKFPNVLSNPYFWRQYNKFYFDVSDTHYLLGYDDYKMTIILNNIYPMNLHEYNIHQKLTWIQRKFIELSNNGLPGTLEEKLKTQLLELINEYDYEEVEILIGIGTSFSKNDLDEILDHFLMHVVKNGNLMVARKLLEAGANVDYDDYSNYPSDTPLLNAIEQGNFKMVQLLLEYGASVDEFNNAEHYPLTEAVYEGNLDIIKLLLEYGASPHFKNGADMTALMIAKENRDKEIIELLLQFGAKL